MSGEVTELEPRLRTERLLLRRFTDGDRDAFADLNSDPAVMATLPSPLTRTESDAFLDRIEDGWDRHGFGLWCVDLDGECLGFTGLTEPWFRDGVEIGWRLRSAFWGRGYAPEAARAALTFGFDVVGLDEILSFTAVTNTKSRRVMDKIGLVRDPKGDFDHPSVPVGHPLRPHVLYRMSVDRYRSRL